MEGKRTRRSQKEVIIGKISKIDNSIKAAEEKLEALKSEKNQLSEQLKEIEEAANQENINAVVSKVATAIKKKKITIEEVEAFLSSEKE